MRSTNKEIFTSEGVINAFKTPEGFTRHTFSPKSSNYVRDAFKRLPVGTKVSMTISEHVAMRSNQQLAYHWILMGYLAEHCGTSKSEMHDAVMRIKFGTKEIKIGGITLEVRKSLSNEARMSKSDVVELVDFDLNLCEQMEIHVPSREELGYDSYK